jgi:hypothetical protein
MIENTKERINTLADELVYEFNKSLGFPKGGLTHAILRPLVWKIMVNFSEIMTNFNTRVVQDGVQKASAWFITHFVDRVKALGFENIPREGPLIVVSNHPGAYDTMVILSRVPRDDIKIISSDIPFLGKFPAAQKHLIFAKSDPQNRMGVARKAIQHLKSGGALLVFARATMDPDPAFMPGAEQELENWSSSLGLFLRTVPDTKIAISVISGILIPRFLKHPARIFRKGRVNKQRVSEFFQVMSQLLDPGKVMVSPSLSFAQPLSLAELGYTRDLDQINSWIMSKVREHFSFHSTELLNA